MRSLLSLYQRLGIAALMALTAVVIGCFSGTPSLIPTPLPATVQAQKSPFPQDISLTTLAIASRESSESGHGHTVFLGTEGGEIWKSADGGETWAMLELPEPSAVLDVAIPIESGSDELFVGAATGLFRSTDGGKTWAELEKDRFKRVWAVSLSPDYARDGRVAIVAAGFNFGDSALVSRDRGQSWEPGPEPASRDIQFLSDGRLAGAINNRAWVESPPGQHLGATTAAAEHRSVSRATFSPDYARDGIVFYGGAYTSAVHRTGNDTPGPKELEFYLGHRGDWCEAVDDSWGGYGPSPNCFIPVTVSPKIEANGFAAVASQDGLFLSRDRGKIWRKVGLLIPAWEKVRAIAISPGFDADSVVAAITSKRVFLSADRAESWKATPTMSDSPPDPNPAKLSSELLRDVSVAFRAEPVAGRPRTYRLIAEINGGPDSNSELHCHPMTWMFGDGNGVVVTDKCREWSPAIKIQRRFEQIHTYEGLGRYEALFFFGPLFAYTVVEIGE